MFEGAQIKMFEGAHLSQMFGKILKCAPSMFRWGTIESNTKVFAKKNIITTFACFRSTASINTSQMCPLKSFVPPGMPAVPGRLMDRGMCTFFFLSNSYLIKANNHHDGQSQYRYDCSTDDDSLRLIFSETDHSTCCR